MFTIFTYLFISIQVTAIFQWDLETWQMQVIVRHSNWLENKERIHNIYIACISIPNFPLSFVDK
jgi:hypothetical protein